MDVPDLPLVCDGEWNMSSKGVGTQMSDHHRAQPSRWVVRLLIILIALILSVIIILCFFSSGAVSR